MSNHRKRHAQRRITHFSAAVLLSLIACGPPRLMGAEDSTADQMHTASEVRSDQPLQGQLDDLLLRIQGMEGKLKDSANARKAADQARMEAERRLAEGRQEIEQLGQAMRMLRDRCSGLEERLNGREAEIDRLQAELTALTTTNADLAGRLGELQRRMPESDGGTLTAAQAREAAVMAFAELREAQGLLRSGGTENRRAIEAAEAALHQQQFRVASALRAASIYRVRFSDSLALISSRLYGNSAEWRRIFEANRHLLEDPDQLVPGMTLVIP